MSTIAPPSTTFTKQDHILIFPFLSKGHIIPLLHLATSLSTRNNILITLITTPSNLSFFHNNLPSSLHNLNILLLPFPPHPSLPSGVESTDSLPSSSLFPTFLSATTSLQNSFLLLLTNLLLSPSPPPLCLISDFFFHWTLPLCRRFRLPRIVFHTMSAFSMSICKSLWQNIPKDGTFSVPGAPPDLKITKADVPETVLNSVDLLNPETVFLNSIGLTDVGSWGVVVNSFAELEDSVYVRILESFYSPVAGGRVWLVGPMNLLSCGEPEKRVESECMRWLNRQRDGSVVYVAFGTQAEVADEQLDEVVHGLVRAGVRFLWAVRSKTWVGPKVDEDLGWIEGGWVQQKAILCHPAVGGFVSHCGWNSVVEAVSAGVPMLTWPVMAEQGLNAKMVTEVIGVGISLRPPEAVVVGRKEVEEGVRELMEGEKGRRVRERVGEMKEKAKAAVAAGGSSYDTIERLLEELRKVPAAVVEVDLEEGLMKVGEDILKRK